MMVKTETLAAGRRGIDDAEFTAVRCPSLRRRSRDGRRCRRARLLQATRPAILSPRRLEDSPSRAGRYRDRKAVRPLADHAAAVGAAAVLSFRREHRARESTEADASDLEVPPLPIPSTPAKSPSPGCLSASDRVPPRLSTAGTRRRSPERGLAAR